MKQNSLKGWFKSGAPGVWISGGAVTIAVIMTIGLLSVIAVRGLGHFWPADLIHAQYNVPGSADHLVIGEVVQKEEVPRERLKSAGLPVPDQGPEFMTRELIKVGNRDLNGNDFTWVPSTPGWSVFVCTAANWSWQASWMPPPKRTWMPSVPS